MKKLLTFTFSLFFILLLQSQSLELVPYATGFTSAIDVTHAGDDRLFVVEQGGRIKIIDGTGTVLATPFLDISSLTNSGGERGLLGLAFHPDYANNGYFFVNYTDLSGETRVVRYSRSTDDPNIADPDSDMEVIMIDQTQGNHNGGCIKFGPDGYLYIGMGDGGGGGDQPNNSQNTGLLLGKMLRLDVDGETPYEIPADNPFVDDVDVLDEIWAIGLRNPWRFSFDRETGDMWIGDVGQNAYEEIDFQPADSPGGENYGWRCYEADSPYNLSGCDGDYVFPAYTIPQSTGVCSITGGFVYRGTEFPELIGKYIFADFCSRDFFMVEPDGDGGWIGELIGEYPYSITSFGEGADGELYCTHYGGQVLQVTYDACSSFSSSVEVTNNACAGEANGSAIIVPNGGTPPYTITPLLDYDNLAAGEYTLTITDDSGCSIQESFFISTLPLPEEPTVLVDGNTLSVSGDFATYQWLFGGVVIEGATSNTYLAAESGDYSLMVTGGNGCSNTSPVVNVMVVGLDAPVHLQELRLTPNPFTTELKLSLAVTEATNLQLGVFALDGKLVYERLISASGQVTETLPLEHLPAGVYYLKLSNQEGAVMRKVVKQ
ncbi:PQQ-dependent sugar dehydrogenase [Lewinella cohaerens]|uniref:PQQ-dependent sugar dehydrogenase n=1 Tax=Lewinella cohaerens TaxID=70995 RepID=UPI000377D126|nr:PQQ-dependent sugar dehydrogenase [Lewinella cohaerens]